MENLEVTTIEDGKRIYQVPTVAPVNVQLMDKAVDEWLSQGQLASSAFDPLLGKEANAGTTFRGQERVVQQGKGLHERRRGQRAKFIEEMYRDWILDDLAKEILQGKKFLATLSSEELSWVSEKLIDKEVETRLVDVYLAGGVPSQEEVDAFKDIVRADFAKKGNKHLIEILKGEFKDVSVNMGINIAGKQKDLAGLSDKIFSIFQTAFANPAGFVETMKIPGMAKAMEDILEFGGLNPVDFSTLVTMPSAPPPQALGQGAPQAPQAPMTSAVNAPIA
jgi:hypothetical protein